ncbi:UNVERIFIED_CONTAM: hypothetical protein FKN15_066404 [Acipenser sinensis]
MSSIDRDTLHRSLNSGTQNVPLGQDTCSMTCPIRTRHRLITEGSLSTPSRG